MLFRRAFYWVQIAAIVLLPLWIIVARSVAARSFGALDVLVFLSWPALAIAMVATLGITWARKSVRSTRTLSWQDVAALSTWYVVAIAFGAFIAVSSQLGTGLTGGLLVLVTIGVMWVATWQLVAAARKRVKTVLASLDYTAIPAGNYEASRFGPDDGRVIRIEQSER